MSELTYGEAAEQLGVSKATVQNWIRQGILSPNQRNQIPHKEIRRFNKNLSNGKLQRLKSRANKSSASRTFIPQEYIDVKLTRKETILLLNIIKELKEPGNHVLFAYFQHQIKEKRLNEDFHPYIFQEMAQWSNEISEPISAETYNSICRLPLKQQFDGAGLLYQMLQKEGRKSIQGSYYTPSYIANDVMRRYSGQWKSFLDPCCGSGAFLMAAAQVSGNPLDVEGWDIDPLAVHIARLNLMLQFPEISFSPRIYVRDSLNYKNTKRFDLIATNPPWGVHFTKEKQNELRKRFEGISSKESFSFFIALALNHLQKEGTASFILPEALLKVKTHHLMRKHLLDESQITYVKYLGKPFQNVQTEVVRMDIQKNKERKKTVVVREDSIYSVDTNSFYQNPSYVFSFNSSERDCRILDKVYSIKHVTLKQGVHWVLGVVTGNNKKFTRTRKGKNWFPLISGKDIEPYEIQSHKKYINFNRQILQQSAPKHVYNQTPKIVYRFITDKPVFAIDRDGQITLNSANSFFLERDDISESLLIAYLNSALFRFILLKKFNSLKVLRSHLEELPIPFIPPKSEEEIISMVKKIEESAKKDREYLMHELDNTIFDLYNIPLNDRRYILETV